MNTLVARGIALVLMLAALPLASFGSTTGSLGLNIAAVSIAGVGGLVAPVLRFVPTPENEKEKEE